MPSLGCHPTSDRILSLGDSALSAEEGVDVSQKGFRLGSGLTWRLPCRLLVSLSLLLLVSVLGILVVALERFCGWLHSSCCCGYFL